MREQEERDKYELIEPKCKLSEVELIPELRSAVVEVIEDREYEEALKKEDLKPRKLVMLHGPPGCGKTSIAHGIAAETGLPLYMVSGAELISSFVGQSEKNVEEVFRFANATECIMLIDEFDSFGQDRARGGATHERRLTNTLLVNMETRPPLGITVTCTNFLDYIDPAILRRFDTILSVPALDKKALIKVAKGVLKDRFGISPEECVAEGKTPSGVVRAAKTKLRQAVLAKAKARGKPKKKREGLFEPITAEYQSRIESLPVGAFASDFKWDAVSNYVMPTRSP